MTTNAKQILNIISTSDKHLTAEQIYLKMKATSSKVVLATVYNNLKTLHENDLIRKVSVEGYPDRYDKVVRHDHLVCKNCGQLTDIILDDLTFKLKKDIKEEILSYDLKISYICSACRQSEPSE